MNRVSITEHETNADSVERIQGWRVRNLRQNEQIAQSEIIHGSIDHLELRRLSIDPSFILDFSSNMMPVVPSPQVLEVIRNTRFDTYPDRHCLGITDAIASHHRIPAKHILAGNGCCDLIHTIANSILKENDLTAIIGPTFSEYSRCSRMVGAKAIELRMDFPFEWTFTNFESLQSRLAVFQPKVVWICNPNNPTGQMIDSERLHSMAKRYTEVTWIIDESYIEFSGQVSLLDLPLLSNLIVLRSMTKYYALAGLRLGFAVMSESLRDFCRSRQMSWSVNSLAQAAGVAALSDKSHYDSAMKELSLETQRARQLLANHGYAPLSTKTGYFLLPVKNAPCVRAELVRQGILVRDCTSFGLESFLRISVRSRSENESLLKLLKTEASQFAQ